jgi:hypothetical protein
MPSLSTVWRGVRIEEVIEGDAGRDRLAGRNTARMPPAWLEPKTIRPSG